MLIQIFKTFHLLEQEGCFQVANISMGPGKLIDPSYHGIVQD